MINLLERDLEDLFYNDLVNGGVILNQKNVDFETLNTGNKSVWYRQVNLNPYGIADIIGFSRKNGWLYIDLIELKTVNSSASHFEQIFRYGTALQRIINQHNKNKFLYNEINYTLVVPKLDDGCYLQNYCNVSVIEYSYGLDGFKFNQTNSRPNWFMTSENFNNGSLKKLIKNGSI